MSPPDPYACRHWQWVGAGRLGLPCCGGTARRASWDQKTQIPGPLAVTGEPLIRHLTIPVPYAALLPAEIQAKGAGWAQALGTLLARGLRGCVLGCPGLARGRERCLGPPTKSSLWSQEPRRSAQRLGERWVLGRSRRDGSSEGRPCAPHPRSSRPWWQQPGRLDAMALPWQGHSGRDLLGGRLILGALRRGYFGPFALRESPAIFRPHWVCFHGRVIYAGWDNAAAARRRAWSPKPCWVPSPPRAGRREGARAACWGSWQLQCGARDAHSRVGQPGARPASLPSAEGTAWLGLEPLGPLPSALPTRDGGGDAGNGGGSAAGSYGDGKIFIWRGARG